MDEMFHAVYRGGDEDKAGDGPGDGGPPTYGVQAPAKGTGGHSMA